MPQPDVDRSRDPMTEGSIDDALPETVEELQAEVRRLRDLVGPDEKSYLQLRLDVMGARDFAIGAAAEAARLRASAGSVDEWRLKAEHLDAVYRSRTWRLGWTLTAPIRLARRVTRTTT